MYPSQLLVTDRPLTLSTYIPTAAPERKKLLLKAIAAIAHRFLPAQEVPVVAVKELGQAFACCRCLLYRCCATDREARIEYESAAPGIPALQGETWRLADNPLLQAALAQDGALALADVAGTLDLREYPALKAQIQRLSIRSWLIAPVRDRGILLGILELQYGGAKPYRWQPEEIALVEAIANRVGVALAQTATADTDPEALNRQLEALEQMRSQLIALVGHELWTPLSTIQACLESLVSEPNLPTECQQAILDTAIQDVDRLHKLTQDFFAVKLPQKLPALQTESEELGEALNCQIAAPERMRSHLTAIVGHELRTPLSTIQVCLESLANEPELPSECRQVMLDTALKDAERLHQLIQDFFTLSRLESGRVYHCPESISLHEAVETALKSVKMSWNAANLPKINIELSPHLPSVRVDRAGLVKVLTKLLDNACKFTNSSGEVTLQARWRDRNSPLEVTVTDTGRGIDPTQLDTIFDCFYQAEGWLRRTTSGTGLGLAICRLIVQSMGGQIWAESLGKDRGSRFYFTLPIDLTPPGLDNTSCSLAEDWHLLVPDRSYISSTDELRSERG